MNGVDFLFLFSVILIQMSDQSTSRVYRRFVFIFLILVNHGHFHTLRYFLRLAFALLFLLFAELLYVDFGLAIGFLGFGVRFKDGFNRGVLQRNISLCQRAAFGEVRIGHHCLSKASLLSEALTCYDCRRLARLLVVGMSIVFMIRL